MLNTVFVTVHALAATVAFVAGVLAVPAGRFLGVYRGALAIMAAALVPAVLVDWAATDPGARAVFAGLFVLAGVMVVRAEPAVRLSRPHRWTGPELPRAPRLHADLLADGFAVVTAIRAGAPGWSVGALAVGVVVVGHVAIRAARRRLVRPAGPALVGP